MQEKKTRLRSATSALILASGALGLAACGGESSSEYLLKGPHYEIAKGEVKNQLRIHTSDFGSSLGDAKTGAAKAIERVKKECGPIASLDKIDANYGKRTMDIFVRVPDSTKCFSKQ